MTDDLDLSPVELDCLRCGRRAWMRFAGLCPECRDELRARYSGLERAVEVDAYEPKANVTANAVALRPD